MCFFIDETCLLFISAANNKTEIGLDHIYQYRFNHEQFGDKTRKTIEGTVIE